MTHNVYTDDRDIAIEKLRVQINERENSSLTFEQVENYIGSDMEIGKIYDWIADNDVSEDDVMALWEEEASDEFLAMSERDQAIYLLKEAIEKTDKSSDNITFEQVAHWVGSDTPTNQIVEWRYDTYGNREPINKGDVLDLWEDCQ